MSTPNLGQIVARAWDDILQVMPDPFRMGLRDYYMDGSIFRSYNHRARLDMKEINCFGGVIPRIERVTRNLRALGNIRLDPHRLEVGYRHTSPPVHRVHLDRRRGDRRAAAL